MSAGVIEYPGPNLLKVTIDRPEALNALGDASIRLLEQAVEHVAQSKGEVRGLIIEGAGQKSFISGGDLKEFAPLLTEQDAITMATRMTTLFATMETLPCWTFASINGPAYGGGCELIVACDWAIALSTATLGWTQTRFKLPPGWGGMTRLAERIGTHKAMQWVAQSHVATASEACEAGMIHEVSDSMESLKLAVQTMASTLAKRHPAHLILALKQARYDSPERWAAIERELKPFASCWADRAHHDAVGQFIRRS